MDLKIKDKVALVLASSKGLGKAIAKTLAAEGCRTIIASRSMDDLEAAAKEIEQFTGSAITCIAADVSKTDEVEQLISEVVSRFNSIDILINNAGGPPFASFESFNDEDWQNAFELNLLSFARMSRLVLPYMKQAGSGRIINIISGYILIIT